MVVSTSDPNPFGDCSSRSGTNVAKGVPKRSAVAESACDNAVTVSSLALIPEVLLNDGA
jgi:hypothetical protein